MCPREQSYPQLVNGDVQPSVLVRPRSSAVLVGAIEVAAGLTLAWVGTRRAGPTQVTMAIAGVALASLGPTSFWFWTRVREALIDRHGVHLRGLGLAVSLPWSEVRFVRAEQLGPTTFLVAQTTSARAMPLLSPFRRRFARRLQSDPKALLVLRTADFPGRATAFGAALHAHAPPSLCLDWPTTHTGPSTA